VREIAGLRSGTRVAEDQADRPRPRVRAPREAAGRRVAISARVGGNGPRPKARVTRSRKRSPRPCFQPEMRPMLHPCGSSRDLPGNPSQVPVGEGLRSGHGPVAEFLVGAAASSTARIHRVLSPYCALQKGAASGEGTLATARKPQRCALVYPTCAPFCRSAHLATLRTRKSGSDASILLDRCGRPLEGPSIRVDRCIDPTGRARRVRVVGCIDPGGRGLRAQGADACVIGMGASILMDRCIDPGGKTRSST